MTVVRVRSAHARHAKFSQGRVWQGSAGRSQAARRAAPKPRHKSGGLSRGDSSTTEIAPWGLGRARPVPVSDCRDPKSRLFPGVRRRSAAFAARAGGLKPRTRHGQGVASLTACTGQSAAAAAPTRCSPGAPRGGGGRRRRSPSFASSPQSPPSSAVDDDDEARHCAYARPRHLSGADATGVCAETRRDGDRAGERGSGQRGSDGAELSESPHFARRRNFVRCVGREPARARLCGPRERMGRLRID